MSTDVTEFMTDLDGGIFAQKLGAVLSEVGRSVIDHDKAGKITIQLDFKRIGNSHQVSISHKLNYSRPTKRGKQSEEDTTQTPMHVGRGGSLTLFPEQQGQLFDKKQTKQTEEN